MATTTLTPRCVATTGDAFCATIAQCDTIRPGYENKCARVDGYQSNLFHLAQFSGDGTTIVALNEDRCLRSFVLPTDLLEETQQPHHLAAQSTLQVPTNVQSYAIYPHFNLPDRSTTVVLSASNDLPISLNNALDFETAHATYHLVHRYTEAYIAPSSLLWMQNGRHFVAGSKDQISIFDPSRDGSGPVVRHKTARGKYGNKLPGSASNPRIGLVSALSINSKGLLAAGTRDRQVGIYEQGGKGDCVTSFSVASSAGEQDSVQGKGITHLAWSPCGTYLVVAERQSDGMQVFDLRNMLRRVSWLSGRKADTTQKLGLDVVPTAEGYEVWAGGTDGIVRMWKDPGSLDGEHVPNDSIKLHEGQ